MIPVTEAGVSGPTGVTHDELSWEFRLRAGLSWNSIRGYLWKPEFQLCFSREGQGLPLPDAWRGPLLEPL